ncbi:glycosyltransferase family 2 protein [Amphritea pacifica]|uniref:Glycosyltransferase family 2 protein n=1 Tax=Amphritea pacifica TaxID=2811233 RepID=A0ABS2W5K6_9GAMM|nr:glycosyltransferase family 2 protein [Amphritea pacifica]
MLKIFEKSNKLTEEKIRSIIAKDFDAGFYHQEYELVLNGQDPLEHFLKVGSNEGFDPCDWFSIDDYLLDFPDVSETGVNPFFHYLYYGRKEGRDIKPSKRNKTTLSDNPLVDLASHTIDDDADTFYHSLYYKEARNLLDNESFTVERWKKWIKKVKQESTPHPNVKAYIESAVVSERGSSGLLVGWVVSSPDSIVWIEDEEGTPTFLTQAHRIFREDVYKAFLTSFDKAEINSGCLVPVKNISPKETLTIYALSSKGVHRLSSAEAGYLDSQPAEMAKWLFTIESKPSDQVDIFRHIFWPMLSEQIARNNRVIARMPVSVEQYGEVQDPLISIIIPLYGRIDFIEGQMVSFVSDEFIKSQTEIIYVVDDPTLVEKLRTLAKEIYDLYKVSFKVVFGGVNRGFSGANNLGAEHASGAYLLFMNSDVFPKSAGWLEPMLEALKTNPELGVIAPRLLFADGSIQHAGMAFQYRSDIGIWINHHPHMGLDPILDPHQALTKMPAVTGACMLISREDFDAVEGWDTGYLIGDFEDSDLCLKLLEKGKGCGYLPSVELTHLERQSFGLTGTPDFRTKVVILNASRHMTRWSDLIEKLAAKPEAAY